MMFLAGDHALVVWLLSLYDGKWSVMSILAQMAAVGIWFVLLVPAAKETVVDLAAPMVETG